MHNSPTWDEKVGNEEEDSNPSFEHRGVDEGLLCHRHGLRSRFSQRVRDKQLLEMVSVSELGFMPSFHFSAAALLPKGSGARDLTIYTAVKPRACSATPPSQRSGEHTIILLRHAVLTNLDTSTFNPPHSTLLARHSALVVASVS